MDPLAELYFNYSLYNYVVGNPIVLIDPNGMEVESIAGGVRFTEEDAKSAFEVITGRKRNVYIDIIGNSQRRNSINGIDKQKGYGSWAVFATKNIGLANEALSSFGNGSLDNLVLETHGKVNSQGVSFIGTDDEGYGKMGTINSNEVAYVNSGATNAVNNSSIQSKVNDLKSLADKVTDGGRFIIAACFVGQGSAGKTFGENLNKLTGNRLNIYLPTNFLHPSDFITSTGRMVNINNSFRVDANIGWLRVSPNGNFSDLRSLRLSTDSQRPVKIAK